MRHQHKKFQELNAQILAITTWIINSLPATEQWPLILELITAFGVALGTIMPMELALAVSTTSLVASLCMIRAGRYQLRQCCIQAPETFETCYTFLDHIATISGGFGHPAVSMGGSNEFVECFCWGAVVEGGSGAVVELVGDGVEVWLVAGDGGSFG